MGVLGLAFCGLMSDVQSISFDTYFIHNARLHTGGQAESLIEFAIGNYVHFKGLISCQCGQE